MIAKGWRSLGAAASILVCAPALASQPIAIEDICVGKTRKVDPVRLRYSALRGIDTATLDTNLDGQVTSEEVFDALTDSYSCGRFERGSKECRTYRGTLAVARNRLAAFQANHPGIIFETIAPYPAEAQLAPSGDTREEFAPLLDPAGRYVSMTCVGLPPQTAEADAPADASATRRPELNLGTFLLTREIGALTLPRGTSGQLKHIPSAELSFVDDKANDKQTFHVDATAGLRLNTGDFLVVPFAQFVRSRVKDTSGAKPTKETSKLALGALLGGYLGARSSDYIEATPLYVRDLEDGNEVIGGRLNWRPGFLYNLQSFNHALQFACHPDYRVELGCRLGGNYLAVKTDAQLIASFGRVLDVGNDPSLVDGRTYLRAGPDLRLTLYGMRGVIDDMAVQVGWRRLFRLSGDRRKVYAFTSSILYWLAGSQHVSIRYGYDRGRDEDTLESYHRWTAGLGVRF